MAIRLGTKGKRPAGRPTADKSDDSGIIIPKKPSVVSPNIGDYTMFLYGEKKVGKTSLCSHFPDALFFMFEPGGKSLKIRQIPDTSAGEPPITWGRFRKYIQKLERTKSVKTIIVDTIDRAYKQCFQFMCDKLIIDHPHDENDYGKSWGKIRDEFESVMFRLMGMGKGVIFLSHAQVKSIETRAGSKHDCLVPTVAGQGLEFARATVDIAAYYGFEGKRRVLTLDGDDYTWAGCGLEENFMTVTGQRVEQVYMGSSSGQAYANLMDAFNNKQKHSRPQFKSDRKTRRRKKGGKLSLA